MEVKQFYDEKLAHASYAILSEGQVALVDPGRDPQPYIDYLDEKNAELVAVFETHPHADFVSCHLELQRKFGIKIYVNPKVGVSYEYDPLDDGDTVNIGKVTVKAVYTPGHSPDHNTYLLYDENGNENAVFTGDSLFVGDVGRPDLRENAGSYNLDKQTLASHMYDTMHNFFIPLKDEVKVYPAHGAGSMCGKNMIAGETYSTIGKERERNWAMGDISKENFIQNLINDQPDVPKYFPFDVEENRKGVEDFLTAVKNVPMLNKDDKLEKQILVIDIRSSEDFKKGHIKGAINIPLADKYETWLGYLISPEEKFYLVADDQKTLNEAIKRTAKIGYEKLIEGAKVLNGNDHNVPELKFADYETLKNHPSRYTIIDVRNESEVKGNEVFSNSINIPLGRLRDEINNINPDKPVAVHCAGGYRSAIGSSILENAGFKPVYDIGDKIKLFQDEKVVS